MQTVRLFLYIFLLQTTFVFGSTDFKYVINQHQNTVSVISGNAEVEVIPVGKEPVDIALSPSKDIAYVANKSSHTVSVIDLSDHAVTATISVGEDPVNINIMPDGKFIYVANYMSQTISIIETATNKVVKAVPLIGHPEDIITSPNGMYAYVSFYLDAKDKISVIDTLTNTVKKVLIVGDGSSENRSMAFAADGAYLCVVNTGSNSVSIIETATNTVISTFDVGVKPLRAVSTPNGEFVYILGSSLDEEGLISIIDTSTNRVESTILVNHDPREMVFNLDGSKGYIFHDDGQMSVIDTLSHTVEEVINMGFGDSVIPLYNGDENKIYLFVSGEVVVMNALTNTIEPIITMGSLPRNRVLEAQGEVFTLSVPVLPVSGECKRVTFLTETELYNTIRWGELEGGTSPSKYQVFRNSVLIGEVSGDGPSVFEDHNAEQNKTYSYLVVAENGGENLGSGTVQITSK